jgi:A/G-specific adenine glycosylase
MAAFRRQILSWYHTNQRELPWRKTRNPYCIWVSEIMLQQTRVAAVLGHYRKFLKRFPTVHDLASANEADVLAAWSGLGYYRRARMLHRAAKQLAAECNGHLPKTSVELQQLPGIGRYTANAIASIAFGESVAVVDGNVERVLNRVMCAEVLGQRLWTTAQQLLDPASPGDFNQAMMELGAMVCTPIAPFCEGCPISSHCASESRTIQNARTREQRQQRTALLLLRRRRNLLLLRRRSERESLMPGMWELPQLNSAPIPPATLKVKHSITTTDWTVEVFASGEPQRSTSMQWTPVAQLGTLPLTGLTRKILRKLKLLA